jgi:xanthine dehydrogenase YagS FAD-binding subunit
MDPFSFVSAKDSQTAIKAVMEDRQAKFMAGSTNLVDLMRMNVEKPTRIVDINFLSDIDLKKIKFSSAGGVRIGALVSNTDLAFHPEIVNRFPVLSQAILSGASPQIRNRATVGGNILQRTRCPYFYDIEFPCNKREPGTGCSAVNGYNRMHAVLGTSEKCIATHPSDMCVALTALGALVHLTGNTGSRTIPFTEFHLMPGNTPEKETVLEHGELITAIEIPPLSFAKRSYYLKVRDRASFDFALVSAAVAMDISQGIIQAVRIGIGGVGTKPWRAVKAEKILTGARVSDSNFEAAASAELTDAKPLLHNEFKIVLAGRTLVRALKTIGGMS